VCVQGVKRVWGNMYTSTGGWNLRAQGKDRVHAGMMRLLLRQLPTRRQQQTPAPPLAAVHRSDPSARRTDIQQQRRSCKQTRQGPAGS
jgi:hypothetical protein